MFFQVTIFLLICQAGFGSTTKDQHHLRNSHQLKRVSNDSAAVLKTSKNVLDSNTVVTTPRLSPSTSISSIAFKATSTTMVSSNLLSSVSTALTMSSSSLTQSESHRRENETFHDPVLLLGDKEISNTNVHSKVKESLEVVCEGDTETIQWIAPPCNLKIANNLPTRTNTVQVEHIEKKKSVLKIKSVAVTDEGEYTCEVSKNTKIKKKSFKLKVIDPVHIYIFTHNLITLEEGHITLPCVTLGHPQAIVNWYFNENPNGFAHSKLIDGQTNSHYQLDGNTLLIAHITYKEAGRYMCEARQDIEKGTIDVKTVDVIVKHKPYPTHNVTAFVKALNASVEIPCKMIANPNPKYTWYRKINGIYQKISLPSVNPVLKVNITNSSQYGEYKCSANNLLGDNDQFIMLNPTEFSRPVKIQIVKVNEAAVYFSAVPESNSYLTHYVVEYKKKNDTNWADRTIKASSAAPKSANYLLDKLNELTTYILRVRSVRRETISDPSIEMEFTTKELLRPPIIELKEIAETFVHFIAKLERNRTLTKYEVMYRTENAEYWSKIRIPIKKGFNWDTPHKLSHLAPKTNYILSVRSMNGLGMSDPSSPVKFTTKESVKPPKFRIIKITENSVRLQPIDQSSVPLQAYKVEYKSKSDKIWKETQFNVPKGENENPIYRLTNLTENTAYILRIKSVNNLGTVSESSDELEFTTRRRSSKQKG